MTMTIQHITIAEVRLAAKKAYDAGNLLAQHPEMTEYFYRRDNTCCAVGACLTPETGRYVDFLGLNCEVVQSFDSDTDNAFTMSEGDRPHIMAIQGAHDVWAKAARGAAVGYSAHQLKRKFLDLLI